MPSPKILLIDGYNVIHKIPELKQSLPLGLENARQKLALLVSTRRHAHPSNECIIIFDGNQQVSGARTQSLAGIRSIFTRTSHGGDAEIIRFVREYRGTKSDIVVVSDDNSVRNSCKAHGAIVQPAAFILAKSSRPSSAPVSAPSRTKGGSSSSKGKSIDRKAITDINNELKKKFGL